MVNSETNPGQGARRRVRRKRPQWPEPDYNPVSEFVGVPQGVKRRMVTGFSARLTNGLRRAETVNDSRIVTRREAAEILKVTERTIDHMARDGRLTSFKIGKAGVRFWLRDVEAFIASASARAS